MTAYDEMMKALNALKEKFGTPLAKEVLKLTGAERAVEVHPACQRTTQNIAEKMVATGSQKEAAAMLMGEFREMNEEPSDYLCEMAHIWPASKPKVRGDAGMVEVQHMVRGDDGAALKLSTGHALSPNDIIATLLDIALAAQRTVDRAPARSPDQAVADYRALADAFAPLQQLPGPLSLTPAERAKLALTTFIQATSVTIAGKDALEGIMAAMDAAVPGFMQAGGRLDMVPNNGWVIAHQTVITMPDGKKELGYTLLSGLGVFTDEADASKSLAELKLPLGYVIMSVEQLLPGYIMPLIDDAVGLEKPVNQVYAVRNYDDAYVEQLSVAVADLATDGKRFRTMIWMITQAMERDDLDPKAPYTAEQQAYFANADTAERIMEKAQPETLEQFRAALDDVYRAGVLPNMDAKAVDSAHAHDVLRAEALKLAERLVENYEDNHGRCAHCETLVEDLDTIDEKHAADCPVVLARQLIENES